MTSLFSLFVALVASLAQVLWQRMSWGLFGAGLVATLGALGPDAARAQAPVASTSASSESPTADARVTAFAERFKARNPGTRVDSVTTSPIAGLYEVVMGRNVAYVDETGRYALFGHVWDMSERRDLTADRKAALERVEVASLPLELAITHVRGSGARVLYVFADPTCGYCRQLEQTLAGMTDITVHTFVVPILGPEAKRIAAALACAAAPAAAWSAWMLKGQEPAAPSGGQAACDAAALRLAALERLATSMGVSGTPTMVAADGRKYAGAMPSDKLALWLAPVVTSGAPAGAALTTKTAAQPASRAAQ